MVKRTRERKKERPKENVETREKGSEKIGRKREVERKRDRKRKRQTHHHSNIIRIYSDSTFSSTEKERFAHPRNRQANENIEDVTTDRARNGHITVTECRGIDE